jgi:nitrous oxidase accessory protein NosD
MQDKKSKLKLNSISGPFEPMIATKFVTVKGMRYDLDRTYITYSGHIMVLTGAIDDTFVLTDYAGNNVYYCKDVKVQDNITTGNIRPEPNNLVDDAIYSFIYTGIEHVGYFHKEDNVLYWGSHTFKIEECSDITRLLPEKLNKSEEK